MRKGLYVGLFLSLACYGAGRSVQEFQLLATAPSMSVALKSLAGLLPCLVPALAGSTLARNGSGSPAQASGLACAGLQSKKVKMRTSGLATAAGAVATTTISNANHLVNTGVGSATNAPEAGQRDGARAANPVALA